MKVRFLVASILALSVSLDQTQVRAFALSSTKTSSSAHRKLTTVPSRTDSRKMAATNQALSLDALEALHSLKTGALIQASVRMGAIIGNADASELQALNEFSRSLGLAFQIRDDILDIEASSEQLGKTAGKDVEQNKSTYPKLLGLHETRQLLSVYAEKMQASLALLQRNTVVLKHIADFAVTRTQ